MLWGAHMGALEIRSEGGATRLRASFPYGAETELAPNRREVIARRAFAERIADGGEIHLLSGHDFNKPLASRSSGTLELTETDAALEIRATVDGGTSWARDFLAAHEAGLIRGLSPGFRVERGGERIERRGSDVLRTITRASLFEISTVTRPAYPLAQVEARGWSASVPAAKFQPLNRWRL